MSEITITRDDIRKEMSTYWTTFDCIQHVKDAGIQLTPEQEFRLTAIFKKATHAANLSVYKYKLNHFRDVIDSKESFKTFVDLKTETHEKFLNLPDEECVTYSVGSHVYKQKGSP